MSLNNLIESLRSIYHWLDLAGFDQFIELIQIAMFVAGQGDANLTPGREATAHTANHVRSRCVRDYEQLAGAQNIEVLPVTTDAFDADNYVVRFLDFCLVLPGDTPINH
ncbi:MAG: hypothetical protein RL120_10780 [Gammaproteobacteria bacterium]